MKELQEIIQKLISLMGFNDFSINFSEESKRFSVFINDNSFITRQLPNFVLDFNFIVKSIAKKRGLEMSFVDINNYRREREEIIIKLARAAAKKAVVTKKEILLPPMNAYERRIVHSELSVHPDLKTESLGEGKERRVMIKPIE